MERKSEGAAESQLTDPELLERVRAGESQAFVTIVRRYDQRLFRVARAIVGSDLDAQDVVQQAYVFSYANLSQFAGASAFSTWLTRIVINEALARQRREGQARDLATDECAPDWRAGSSRFPSPEDDASRRELTSLLEAAIDGLPETCRIVLVLREVEGLSTTETAQCLSISEGAVRSRMHRARSLLREDLRHRVGAAAADVFRFEGERCDRMVRNVLAQLGASIAVPRPSLQPAAALSR